MGRQVSHAAVELTEASGFARLETRGLGVFGFSWDDYTGP